MTKIACKGTALQQYLGTTFTTVAQVITLELPNAETETFECDTLDNTSAGIPHQTTERTEGGSCSGDLFLDPVLAGHITLTDLLTTPAEEEWQIIFSDAASTEWPFTGAGFSLGGSIALADGIKASFSIKLDGIPTYPT